MKGAIYGIEPTPEGFKILGCVQISDKQPLYLAVISSMGVIGAMMGGVLCASAQQHKAIPIYVL